MSGVLRILQVIMILAPVFSPALNAATFTVNSTSDAVDATPGDGSCSTGTSCTLRAAIMEANALSGPDVIRLPAGDYILSLPETGGDDGGDLLSTDELRIEGSEGAVIDADNISRALRATAPLEVLRVVIQHGMTTGDGGCVRASGTDLTLRQVELWNCQGGSQGGGVKWNGSYGNSLVLQDVWIHACQASNGGGLYATGFGVVILSRCTFNANYADVAEGGGAYLNTSVGALSGSGTFINSSTFHGNSAERDGGGLANWGPLELNSSTITGNFCDLGNDGSGDGGGVYSTSVNLRSHGSIIAGNFSLTGGLAPDDCRASFTSLGYNLVGDTGDCAGFGGTDVLGLDSDLGSLIDNGGFTPTRVPNATSPAVDGGDPAGCVVDVDGDWDTAATLASWDQRLFERSVDGDGAGGARCDIGSTEYGATGAVFADGFESGDTLEWSASVP